MSLSGKYAIQRVFDVSLFDLSTGENIGYFTDMRQSNFNVEGTVVYAEGSPGHAQLVGFDHSKRATLACQSALFDLMGMGAQFGATPVTGTNTNLVITDILTVTSNSATATYTPLGTAPSQVKFAYKRNADGSLGQKFTQVSGAPATGQFSLTGQTLTFFAGDFTNGEEAVIFYNATAGASTKTLVSHTDLFAKTVKAIANGLARDTCSGEDVGMQIIIPQAKLSNTTSFELTSDGSPSVHSFELNALKPCNNTKLFEMIFFDEDETV